MERRGREREIEMEKWQDRDGKTKRDGETMRDKRLL